MRRGILQLFLAALVLLEAVASEKQSNRTSEAPKEKDHDKAETGHISFHVRPQGDYGSRSSSQSKSSSKSHGSGTGKGYGYGSNGPDDKGPQGGGHGVYREQQRGSNYRPSYGDESKVSGEAYKSSGEQGDYRGGHHHRDASPEYPANYEEKYDSRSRYGPRYQSDESHGKGYSSAQSQNRGYSSAQSQNRGYSPSSGVYGKDASLPSVSPDGYIESHSTQHASSSEDKSRPQSSGPQIYDSHRESYAGPAYQGGQQQQHVSANQGYGEFSGRDLSAGYGGPAAYGGFVPMTDLGGIIPKHEPYSNAVGGKDIDLNKLSLFIKQLGQLPLSQVQGKNIYGSSEGTYGQGGKEQQGYLLFPLVPKGTDGDNSQAAGYGGRESYSGYNDGKNSYAVLKDSGYNSPAYSSQQPGNYEPQQNNQGRDYVGASGNYGSGGHQADNVAYHQGKGNYGQSQEVVPVGKNVYDSHAGVYGGEGGYAKQQNGQSGVYGGDVRYEPSVGSGQYGNSKHGSAGDGVAYGHGSYETSSKYGAPSGGKSAPASEGYGHSVTGSGGSNYKSSGIGATVSYTSAENLPVKDHPREYRGVVNFSGGLNNGYGGGNVHAVSLDSQGKSNANYDSAGPSNDGLGYGKIGASLGNGNQASGKSYPLVGFIENIEARSPEGGYGDVSHKGIDQPINIASSQPIAPKGKKSLAIILQKQPVNVPSLAPELGAFGPELGAQFKAPFDDYLGGGAGFDFNLDSYGPGVSGFDTGFKGRDSTSDLLRGYASYGTGGLTPVDYASNGKFY